MARQQDAVIVDATSCGVHIGRVENGFAVPLPVNFPPAPVTRLPFQAGLAGAIAAAQPPAGQLPVVLVPHGLELCFPGAITLRPGQVARACATGAVLASIASRIDRVYMLDWITAEAAEADTRSFAVDAAVTAGAERRTVRIVRVEVAPLPRLPGNAVRYRITAAGPLDG